jgi:hypothetical protein
LYQAEIEITLFANEDLRYDKSFIGSTAAARRAGT